MTNGSDNRNTGRKITTLCAIAFAALLISGNSILAAEPEIQDPFLAVDDEEPIPEFGTFQKAGYQMVNWSFDDAKKQSIYRNIVLPDFIARTKKEEPKFPSFDFALENLTGGDFNDVLVWSRLPGDCNINGCMAILFHLVGEKWEAVARFQAIGVMHRYAPTRERTPELVAVGDTMNPSSIFRWNGKTFVETK